MKTSPSPWEYKNLEERSKKLRDAEVIRDNQADDVGEMFKQSLDPERKEEVEDIKEQERLAIQRRIDQLQEQLDMIEQDVDIIIQNLHSGTATLERLVNSQREKMQIEAALEQEKLNMSKLWKII